MTNRPIVASDPTGHFCVGDVEECIGNDKVDGGGTGDGGKNKRDQDEKTDTNDNGVPDVADPNWVIPPIQGICQYDSLIECLYSGGAWPDGKNYTFTDEEWRQFTLALYYDVYRRSHEGDGFWTLEYDPTGISQDGGLFVPFHTEAYYHRTEYDTPFWNGYGAYSGDVCFKNGKCYDRNDFNYIAQGVWSGAAHEGDTGAIGVPNVWKWNQYGHLASRDVTYWSGRGLSVWDYYINTVGKP